MSSVFVFELASATVSSLSFKAPHCRSCPQHAVLLPARGPADSLYMPLNPQEYNGNYAFLPI